MFVEVHDEGQIGALVGPLGDGPSNNTIKAHNNGSVVKACDK